MAYAPRAFPVQVHDDFVAVRQLRSNGTGCPTSSSGYGTRADGRAAEGPGGHRYNGRRPILYNSYDEIRRHPGEPAYPHHAMDITCALGAFVVSPVDGVVPAQINVNGAWWPGAGGGAPKGGNYAFIRDAQGYIHYFAHMLELPLVRPNDHVRANQIIGLCGRTGNARGGCAHLHYAVTDPRGNKLNPYSALLALYEANGWLRAKSVLPWLALGAVAVGGGAWWFWRRRRRRGLQAWP